MLCVIKKYKRLFPSFLNKKKSMKNFWVLYSVPLVCRSVLVSVPHCLDDCGFVILLEVWESYASCLVFVPQNCFGDSGSFVVPYTFLDCLF